VLDFVREAFGWGGEVVVTEGPRGALGRIWRVEVGADRYALKEIFAEPPSEAVIAAELEFARRAAAAGVRLPASHADRAGRHLLTAPDGTWLRLYDWVDLEPTDITSLATPRAVGALLARLHRCAPPAAAEPGGAAPARWYETVPAADAWTVVTAELTGTTRDSQRGGEPGAAPVAAAELGAMARDPWRGGESGAASIAASEPGGMARDQQQDGLPESGTARVVAAEPVGTAGDSWRDGELGAAPVAAEESGGGAVGRWKDGVPAAGVWPVATAASCGAAPDRRAEAESGADRAATTSAPAWVPVLADRLATLPDLCASIAPVDPAALLLCHRDLHPENVLAGPAGELVVVDWDNLGPAEPGRELARALFDWCCDGPPDLDGMAAMYGQYLRDGGPGRVRVPADFTMLLACRLNFLLVQARVALDPDAAPADRAWAEREIDESLRLLPTAAQLTEVLALTEKVGREA